MKFLDGIRLVANNLRRRKGRTFLTALGVTIGTAAIIAMVSLAIGLQASTNASFDSFTDLTTLDIWPMWDPNTQQNQKELTASTVSEMQKIPGVSGVMATVNSRGGSTLKMGRMTGWANVVGIDLDRTGDYPFSLAEGRMPTSKGETVVTWQVPGYLYEERPQRRDTRGNAGIYEEPVRVDMLNKTITLELDRYDYNNNTNQQKVYKFKVVGILSESFNPWETSVYLSEDVVREMNKWFGAGEPSGRITADNTTYDAIRVKVASRDEVADVVDAIRAAGYDTWSMAEQLEEINRIFLIMQLVLGGIGAISLLVASIGIMNTMFMSILERTREIGIMKVLGADLGDIRRLFLMESGFIGLIGGVVGIALAYGIVGIVNALAARQMNDPSGMGVMGMEGASQLAIIPFWLSLFALGFAIFIGILSGWLPARRAARISPLQAIRQE